MKLNRTPHDPSELLEFYEAGLSSLGALCERTWHDRLQVVAEGRAATLWNPQGALHDVELHFTPADTTSARDAAHDVFPGCPLTFQLAEALRPQPLALERFVLAGPRAARPPEAMVAEKLWRSQFADTTRWQLTAPFQEAWHFSLVALARCEIQAMNGSVPHKHIFAAFSKHTLPGTVPPRDPRQLRAPTQTARRRPHRPVPQSLPFAVSEFLRYRRSLPFKLPVSIALENTPCLRVAVV